ncbi:MAG: Penicillin-binding protein 2B [candidate division WS6 bacterium OLB20]|uniref:beta-lactamase n=1 Tax=candidate division WS6 bacterium OLB20 TaxID=1617426 RepID=A0A136M0I4_9BACT|nr:MAG: Penicillin-binding protein 2B [candidate division WS6 bacterium OLB20]
MSVAKIHTAKLRLIATLLLLLAFGAIVLAFRWQLIDNEQFIAIANERYRDIRIPSLRGTVLAADGSTLAFSEPRFDVYIWLPELERAESRGYQSREEFTENVAEILATDEESIESILDSGPWWLKIADRIDVDTKNKLEEVTLGDSDRHLQGLQFEYVSQRVYPENSLGSHIIGFVGSNATGEQVGVGGLEQYWEGSLKPQEGFESGEFDSFGNPIIIGDNEPLEPKPGVTLYTTIDKTLQGILEKQLKLGVNRFGAASATGIIIDPKTGAVLALANVPDYNPNAYYEEKDGSVFGNHAITIPYEVGSVAKVFTLAAAVDLETLEPDTYVLPQGHQAVR